jgi:hypothetical protein
MNNSKKYKKYQNGGGFDLQGALTGVQQGAGGTDILGNALPGMIPGGGIISGGADIIGGIGDIISSGRDIRRAKKQRKKASGQIKDFYEAEGKGKYDFLTSQAQRDLATAGIRKTDQSQMASNLATSLGAMSSDPRALLGGAAGLQMAADKSALAAQQTDVNRELAAKTRLAGQEQRTLDQNRSLDRALGMRQLGQAEQAKAQAIQNAEAARQARREGIGNIVKGVANVGIGIASGGALSLPGGGGGGSSTPVQTAPPASFYGNQTPITISPNQVTTPVTPVNPTNAQEVVLPVGSQQSSYGFQEGGQVPEQEGGGGDLLSRLLGAAEGRNMDKTPGEFSHEENPIHMVDDSGNKVGEATGGEYILNPTQAEEIDKVQQGISEKVETGKKPSRQELMLLYKAVRGVFSQPQFDEA